MVTIQDAHADYLMPLLLDRIDDLERRLRVVVTAQEEREVLAELSLARAVLDGLRQGQ
jgi:hypothetical protein